MFILVVLFAVIVSCGNNNPATPGESSSNDHNFSSIAISSSSVIPDAPLPFLEMVPLSSVSYDWTPALQATWQGILQTNISPYSTGLVHRPYSETPGDAVSEGVAYGMMLALYNNDQQSFNSIWQAAEQYLWNGAYYDWRANESGAVVGTGAATDADQDIALWLIFADDLVQKNIWQPLDTNALPYKERALSLLDAMWNARMITSSGILAPGAGWGGQAFVNPGYFAPAFYKIFAQFDTTHNWDLVVQTSYDIIEANPGYALGLLPDWMAPSGELLPRGPGYNAYGDGKYLYKDAIRVYWRLATDALWFKEPRAISFLQNAMAFLQSKASQDTLQHPNSPAHLANFYTMQGELLPAEDVFIFAGATKQRPRREHSHLTLGMWAAAAMGAGNVMEAEAFSRQLQLFYEGNSHWGLTTDPSGMQEDIEHNEMYFDQFLAWFGASILNGTFCNILTCIP
jgi:endo-1,4-beta-D-glucanase Y